MLRRTRTFAVKQFGWPGGEKCPLRLWQTDGLAAVIDEAEPIIFDATLAWLLVRRKNLLQMMVRHSLCWRDLW